MVREDAENPFVPPAVPSVEHTEETFSEGKAQQVWVRFFLDAISLLLSSLGAFILRFGIRWDNFVVQYARLYLRYHLVLILLTLMGIWMLRGYTLAQVNRSLRHVWGILFWVIVVESVASTFPWFRQFGQAPRTALAAYALLSIVLVVATRRFIRLS